MSYGVVIAVQASGQVRQALVDPIWFDIEPFAGFPINLYQGDLQGWGANHPFLSTTVADLRPQVIVEVEVWMGASTATMATKLKELEIDGVVIAVDTSLGSADHWDKKQ